jgi:hypothetical protein
MVYVREFGSCGDVCMRAVDAVWVYVCVRVRMRLFHLAAS